MQVMRDLGWTARQRMTFLLAAFGICLLAGCAAAGKRPVVESSVLPADTEQRTWEEGMSAFEVGDYGKAAAVFEFLNDSAGNEKLARRALFALACTRLVMADTAVELAEALRLWNCWAQTGPVDRLSHDDPRLLAPFLDRIGMPGTGGEQGRPKAARPRRKASYSEQIAIRDLATYKNMVQARERELEKIKGRLESREREIRRLKHQIDSLEAIHLKYQEKKKEISSP